MRIWIRRIAIVVLAGAVVLAGLFLFAVNSMGHRHYEVDGVLHVALPGPDDVRFPAIACMWANSYGMPTPSADLDDREGLPMAQVVCRLPPEGADLPFHVSHYSNSGRGLLIAGFLPTLPVGVAACGDAVTVVAVPDATGELGGICAEGDLPPRSQIAMMAPFDDDEGRPTRTLRVRIHRAE